MVTMLEVTTFGPSPGIQYGSGEESTAVCFRCGVCCTKYQVRLSLMEAQRIAEYLGLSLDMFLDSYVAQRPYIPESFLLLQRDGACVFLKHTGGSNKTTCLIHPVKPTGCREWMPSLYRRECREGLAEYWNLTLSSSGQLEGSEEKLRNFRSFIRSLRIAQRETRPSVPYLNQMVSRDVSDINLSTSTAPNVCFTWR